MKIQILGHEIDVPRKFINTAEMLILKTVSSRRQAREIYASAIAALSTDDIRLQSLLADRISRFFECDGIEDIEAFMIERNIPWQRPSQTTDGIDSNIDSPAPESGLDKPPQLNINNGNAIETGPNPLSIPQNNPIGGGHKPLPPLDQVHATIIVRDLPLIQPRLSGAGGWGGGRLGSGDSSWDKDVGRQGEQIVFNEEIAKVKSFGFDPGCVIWESQNNPQSSYDIKSIDSEGKELWIEVKSTTGTVASFPWTSSEFDMALKKQDSYYLCRVYEADSVHPSIEIIKNPIKLLLEGKIALDFETGIVKMVSPDLFE